ncbi:hypothetical protein LOTGIDRAFT_175206 [Lottia gigantea]|uniref:Uncharacterized protein n=1 Tax=Lottia gigantea TaxID=225164 RepID=V4AKH1_LOTGI|nr:hypothetical protein LOTGIDRAFT_175206 [Lottia gigantea]ESO95235.1 hypothetical protein LOTGIDRAFT_175206 [Lottia gigantea]
MATEPIIVVQILEVDDRPIKVFTRNGKTVIITPEDTYLLEESAMNETPRRRGWNHVCEQKGCKKVMCPSMAMRSLEDQCVKRLKISFSTLFIEKHSNVHLVKILMSIFYSLFYIISSKRVIIGTRRRLAKTYHVTKCDVIMWKLSATNGRVLECSRSILIHVTCETDKRFNFLEKDSFCVRKQRTVEQLYSLTIDRRSRSRLFSLSVVL